MYVYIHTRDAYDELILILAVPYVMYVRSPVNTTYSHLSYRRNGYTHVSFGLVSSSSCYPIVIQIGRSILYRPIARRKTHNSLRFRSTIRPVFINLATWSSLTSRQCDVITRLDEANLYRSLHVFLPGRVRI